MDTDGEQGSADLERTVFVHDGGQIVLELEDTVTTTSEELTKDALTHRYLWGVARNHLLVDEAVASLTDSSQNDTLFALTDHLDSVRDLVDENQTARKHTEFDSFGQITGETFYDKNGNQVTSAHAEAVEQLFGYTGHPLDESTGLNMTLHRPYEAATGGWLSTDPTGFSAGDTNLYRYVGNMSTTYVDPDGLDQKFYEVNGGQYNESGNYVKGVFIHERENNWWPWSPNKHVRTVFVPTTGDTQLDKQNISRKMQECRMHAYAQGIADQVDTNINVGVQAAVFGIPGPEDLVIGAAARLGHEVVRIGGRWAIKVGGKILTGKRLQSAIERIQKAGPYANKRGKINPNDEYLRTHPGQEIDTQKVQRYRPFNQELSDCEQPIMIVVEPNGTKTIMQGNHRIRAAAADNLESVEGYIFTREEWKEFIKIMEDLID